MMRRAPNAQPQTLSKHRPLSSRQQNSSPLGQEPTSKSSQALIAPNAVILFTAIRPFAAPPCGALAFGTKSTATAVRMGNFCKPCWTLGLPCASPVFPSLPTAAFTRPQHCLLQTAVPVGWDSLTAIRSWVIQTLFGCLGRERELHERCLVFCARLWQPRFAVKSKFPIQGFRI